MSGWNSNEVILFSVALSNVSQCTLTGAPFYRDTAFRHIVLTVDTTQIVPSERVIIKHNGVRIPLTGNYPALNQDLAYINNNVQHWIGQLYTYYSDMYIGEVNFVDSQALDATSFGYFDVLGEWHPRKYSGAYGANGFYLPFNDGSSAVNLGYDRSGTYSSNLRELGANIGGMTSQGGLAAAFNGLPNLDADCAMSSSLTSGYVTANAVGKDWGVGNTKTITAFIAKTTTNGYFRGDGPATIGIKLQGSDTGAFAGEQVDLYSNAAVTGNVVNYTLQVTSGISLVAYRFHRVVINGNGANYTRFGEVEFYEAGTTGGLNNWTPNNFLRDGSVNDCWTTDTFSNPYATMNMMLPNTGNFAYNVTGGGLNYKSGIGSSYPRQYSNLPLNELGSYAEFKILVVDSAGPYIGISTTSLFQSPTLGGLGYAANEYGWAAVAGIVKNNNVTTFTLSTFTTNDMISLKYVAGNLYAYKNGTIQNSGNPIATGLSASTWLWAVTSNTTTGQVGINFGQIPWTYPALAVNTIPLNFKNLALTQRQ